MLLPTLIAYLLFAAYWLACRVYGMRSTFSALSMMSYFTFGCVGAVLISLYAESIHLPLPMEYGTGYQKVDPGTWLTGPLIEEIAKALPVFVLVAFAPAARRIGIADFALIGFASGLGFGFVEGNFGRVLSHDMGALLAGDLKAFANVWSLGYDRAARSADYVIYDAGHWTHAGLVGLALGVGVRLWPRDARKWAPGVAMLALVSFDHAMWNWKQQHQYPNSFDLASKPVELLYRLTLHGALEIVALPLLLIGLTWWEARLTARSVSEPQALRLPDETPGLRGELALLWAGRRLGVGPLGRILAYFRHRRAYGLAASDAAREPGRAEAQAYAATALRRLEAERAQVAAVERSANWLPTGPQARAGLIGLVKAYSTTVGLALFTLVVFGVAPRYVPWLHQGQAVVFAALASAAFVAWRIWVFAKSKAPTLALADGEQLAQRRVRYILLASSVVSSGLPLLALTFHKATLLPVNHMTHALTALLQWLFGGGSSSVLFSTAGAMAAAVAGGAAQGVEAGVSHSESENGPIANIPSAGGMSGAQAPSLAGASAPNTGTDWIASDSDPASAGSLASLTADDGNGAIYDVAPNATADIGEYGGGGGGGGSAPPIDPVNPVTAALNAADLEAMLASGDDTQTSAAPGDDGDDDIEVDDDDADGEVLHAPVRTAGGAAPPTGKGGPGPQDKEQTLGAGGKGGDGGDGAAGGAGAGTGGKGGDPAPTATPSADPKLQALIDQRSVAVASGDPAAIQAADANLAAYGAATQAPHTVERAGTGAPVTPEAPAPVDPSTTPEAIEMAKRYQHAQDDFNAAQKAADDFTVAHPNAPLDPDLAYRLGAARLNLEGTPRPPSIWDKGRAPLSADDKAAAATQGDVARERTQIDNLPPGQREIASRGVVMAGQGDQTPSDPALAPKGPGKWETMLTDKIAELDTKIAAATTQHELNQLNASRDDTIRRLKLYKKENDNIDALNTDDNNAAFGVQAAGVTKIVDLGSGAVAGEAGKQLTPMEAPVRMSDGTKATIARAYVANQIKTGAAGPPPAAGGPAGETVKMDPNATVLETAAGSAPKAAGDSTIVSTGETTVVGAPGAAGELPPGLMRDQHGAIVFTDVAPLTPAQQATAYEVRNLNIDKQLGAGVSPAYTGEYSKPLSELRAGDIAELRGKGPEFWQSIQDPKQKLYLEQLRDSPNPGLQIDKSMGPTFHPEGPGRNINREGLAPLVRGGGPPVDPKAATVDVPPKGKP